MRKVLLALLVFISLILTTVPSEVLAVCNYCPAGQVDIGTQCAVGGGRGASVVPKTLGCASGQTPSTLNPADAACVCQAAGTGGAPGTGTPVTPAGPATCTAAGCTSGAGQSCDPNTGTPGSGAGVFTAIGCIPAEPKALVEAVLRMASLASGGIAFLLMILASLQMITAEGNPESLKNARDKFYSAIIGLLIVIFAVLMLQVIGVDILNLPGFGR